MNTLVKYGALSADVGSEEAIDVVLHNTYPDPDGLWKGYRRLKFVPFNPNDKFTMAVIEDERSGQVFRLMKGAPQVRFQLLLRFLVVAHQVVACLGS